MAESKELAFRYTDDRDQNNPGHYLVEPRGQLVAFLNEDEEKVAKKAGFTVVQIIGRKINEDGTEMRTKAYSVCGMDIEDQEIIPFPNKVVANIVAEMINIRTYVSEG